MISREMLDEMLHKNVLTVTFIKKDGTERVMECTLREDLLPPKPENTKEKKVNEAVMPVYDLEAKGFRSFRVDSIKNVDIKG